MRNSKYDEARSMTKPIFQVIRVYSEFCVCKSIDMEKILDMCILLEFPQKLHTNF
jgi:hypothetical protein